MIECTVSRKLIKTQFDNSRTIFEKKKIIRLHINESKNNENFKFILLIYKYLI